VSEAPLKRAGSGIMAKEAGERTAMDTDIAGTCQRIGWFFLGVIATLIILVVLFGGL
jgi:hypothetical protein